MKRLAVLLVFVLGGCAAGGPSPTSSGTTHPTSTPTAPPPSASPSVVLPTLAPGTIREVRADFARLTAGAIDGRRARDVVAGDTAFALRFYADFAGGSDNLIFSPYSISSALSMTYGGARGETAAQLAAALGAGTTPADWHAGRNDLDTWLARPQGDPESDITPLTIDPTNALFGQDGFAFEQAYLELLARDYGAGIKALDFAADPEAARMAINQWVAVQTRDRILKLLGPGTISAATRFALVNAIYFKGSWVTPFEKEATTDTGFHLLDGTTVRVPTMHGSLEGSYATGAGWQAFDVPYSGARMTIILPDAGRFADVERSIDPAFLAALDENPAFDRINLALPRWSTTTALDLVERLKQLGVTDLFDGAKADLTGIADARLYVGAVIHQATITVDENGTEAAAATAVVGDTSGGGPDDEVSVTVDRPFIYLIRDNGSNEILFAGRVLDPSSH
jgi:serpin B